MENKVEKIMEKEPKIESCVEKEELDEIKPPDYLKLREDLDEWLKLNEELPTELWEKMKDANQEENLRQVLLRIREELFALYGDKRDEGKSFKDSRFTPLTEMVERGMISCGSMVKIMGTILRKLGIPTKFVHGILESQKEISKEHENRHSWLKIYIPKNDKWLAVDPTQGNFKVSADAEEIKEYHDWEELKNDYAKGEF